MTLTRSYNIQHVRYSIKSISIYIQVMLATSEVCLTLYGTLRDAEIGDVIDWCREFLQSNNLEAWIEASGGWVSDANICGNVSVVSVRTVCLVIYIIPVNLMGIIEQRYIIVRILLCKSMVIYVARYCRPFSLEH